MRIRILLVILLGSSLVGCSASSMVSGTVTVGGEKAIGGAVAFHPVSGGPTATGEIGSDGRYTLSVGGKSGLPSGEYKVTVVVHGPPQAPANPIDSPPAPKLLSDGKYSDLKTTPITKTVGSGSNDVPLEVEPSAKSSSAK